MRILCVAEKCHVWVNGEPILDADLDQLAQIHGKQIRDTRTRMNAWVPLFSASEAAPKVVAISGSRKPDVNQNAHSFYPCR